MKLELRPFQETGGPWGDWFDPATGKDILRVYPGREVSVPLVADVNFRGRIASYAPAVNEVLSLFRYTIRPLFVYRMRGTASGSTRRSYYVKGSSMSLPDGDRWFRVNAIDWRYLPGTVTVPAKKSGGAA